MFWAIHATTGAEVNALELETLPDSIRREDNYYARAVDIEMCPDDINIDMIKVRFRKGGGVTPLSDDRTPFDRRPCFYIQKDYFGKVKTRGESPTHKVLKELLWSALKDKKISFVDIEGNKLSFNFDYSALNYEVIKKNGRVKIRADVSIDFKENHKMYGKGIHFEIQLSQQYDYIKDRREIQRALTGYSVAWLNLYDFFDRKTKLFVEDRPSIVINSCYYILHEQKPAFLKEIRTVCEYHSMLLDRKVIAEVTKAVEARLLHKCPKCRDYLKLRQGKYGKFYGCNSFPDCDYKLGVEDVENERS